MQSWNQASTEEKKVQTIPAVRQVWSEAASEALRDCFETTIWEALCTPHGDDIDNLTDCITDYMNFCVENTVPTRSIHCYANNKPWVTPELKALLNEKRGLSFLGTKRR